MSLCMQCKHDKSSGQAAASIVEQHAKTHLYQGWHCRQQVKRPAHRQLSGPLRRALHHRGHRGRSQLPEPLLHHAVPALGQALQFGPEQCCRHGRRCVEPAACCRGGGAPPGLPTAGRRSRQRCWLCRRPADVLRPCNLRCWPSMMSEHAARTPRQHVARGKSGDVYLAVQQRGACTSRRRHMGACKVKRARQQVAEWLGVAGDTRFGRCVKPRTVACLRLAALVMSSSMITACMAADHHNRETTRLVSNLLLAPQHSSA